MLHYCTVPLQWRHNESYCVSNHRRLDGMLNRLFRRRSKKTSKPALLTVCEGNPPVTTGFPSQTASNAGNVSIWWRHNAISAGSLYYNKYGTYFFVSYTGPLNIDISDDKHHVSWEPTSIAGRFPMVRLPVTHVTISQSQIPGQRTHPAHITNQMPQCGPVIVQGPLLLTLINFNLSVDN